MGQRVSIPYGKGKDNRDGFALKYVYEYQFPMGKVKLRNNPHSQHTLVVSIPYGKGKVRRPLTLIPMYRVSIPYGKGKVSMSESLRWSGFSINSLWER